jgi:hypothetical protein
MDPITIIVAALAAGSAAGLKETASKAIQDAYAGLRKILEATFGHEHQVTESIEKVAKQPEDRLLREELGRLLKQRTGEIDNGVLEAAMKTRDAIETDAPDVVQAIGMDIGEFKAASLSIKNLRPPNTGTSFKARKVDIAGDATIDFGDPPDPKG